MEAMYAIWPGDLVESMDVKGHRAQDEIYLQCRSSGRFLDVDGTRWRPGQELDLAIAKHFEVDLPSGSEVPPAWRCPDLHCRARRQRSFGVVAGAERPETATRRSFRALSWAVWPFKGPVRAGFGLSSGAPRCAEEMSSSPEPEP